MACSAFPQEMRFAVDVDLGEALSPSTLCQTVHLLDCQHGMTSAEGAPLTLLNMVWSCRPLMALGALPQQF
jgi:hypothetical protein